MHPSLSFGEKKEKGKGGFTVAKGQRALDPVTGHTFIDYYSSNRRNSHKFSGPGGLRCSVRFYLENCD